MTNYPLNSMEDYRRWFYNYQFYLHLKGKTLILER